MTTRVTDDSTVLDVIDNPAFAGFGRFLFPTERGLPNRDMAVSTIGALLPYHENINAKTTVGVINYFLAQVAGGRKIFYGFYSDEEKKADPSRRNAGLFYFRGVPGAPFAVACAGGGFTYVGSIHESFPVALNLCRKGYNAFALQYRSGGPDFANKDLAAAISFIFNNAETLGVGTSGYSIWGASDGARMAANLGSYGAAFFGGDELPRPVTVVMQYTGHSDYTVKDPPTFAVVGKDDLIAPPQRVGQRVKALKAVGIDAEFHEYPNVGHGFGLGIGTPAEGWFAMALKFWEKQMAKRET
ncbi:MAG: alpha/beta hydrolase [Deltaproteobacteria bacterium]|nr:alpha/beta hydrolase [Deltaproteobacteria bacterium]